MSVQSIASFHAVTVHFVISDVVITVDGITCDRA